MHLVEPLGRGGPYQHAMAVAEGLARLGHDVVLHTATDAELIPDHVAVCRCFDWRRGVAGRVRRRVSIAGRYLTRTLPHLARSARRGDLFHLQGMFKPALGFAMLALLRLTGARVVHSPHNTFSRKGRVSDLAFMKLSARVAQATIVFSEQDASRVRSFGGHAILAPLIQKMPIDPEAADVWRARWRSAAPVVLFAGQIRPDKRLDLMLRASLLCRQRHSLAVVGEDKGDAERCRELAEELGVAVEWWVEYVDLTSFVGALAAAAVVVCPYDRASQSGVLSLAGQLGTTTVATDVGGLGELASFTAPPDDAGLLAEAIDAGLSAHAEPAQGMAEERAIRAHLSAYGRG